MAWGVWLGVLDTAGVWRIGLGVGLNYRSDSKCIETVEVHTCARIEREMNVSHEYAYIS